MREEAIEKEWEQRMVKSGGILSRTVREGQRENEPNRYRVVRNGTDDDKTNE